MFTGIQILADISQIYISFMDNKKLITATNKKGMHIVFGIFLLISFFLPWVKWNETLVAGFDLPAGHFFTKSVNEYGPANPFPQLDFTFYIFWLLPVLLLVSIIFAFNKRTTKFPALIAGALSLSLVTIFFLFTKTLIEVGVGRNIYQMLQLPAYVAVAAAIGFIWTVYPGSGWSSKLIWIIAGPVLAFSAYQFGEKKVMVQTYAVTDNVKADFTISANELLNEFLQSDSLANAKYREKIVVVNGSVSQIEKTSDSTTNIRFDHTEGSYINFSLDKDQYEQVKTIKTGDEVSLKGSCSGSMYSEILGTTAINFKRSTFNK